MTRRTAHRLGAILLRDEGSKDGAASENSSSRKLFRPLKNNTSGSSEAQSGDGLTFQDTGIALILECQTKDLIRDPTAHLVLFIQRPGEFGAEFNIDRR